MLPQISSSAIDLNKLVCLVLGYIHTNSRILFWKDVSYTILVLVLKKPYLLVLDLPFLESYVLAGLGWFSCACPECLHSSLIVSWVILVFNFCCCPVVVFFVFPNKFVVYLTSVSLLNCFIEFQVDIIINFWNILVHTKYSQPTLLIIILYYSLCEMNATHI